IQLAARLPPDLGCLSFSGSEGEQSRPACTHWSDLASNGGCGRLELKDLLSMTIQLPENLESSIREAVHSGQFPSIDDAMAEAARLLLSQLKQRPVAPPPATGEEPLATAHKPIWEVIEEENQSIPPEVWDSLPTDLSEQHDHYIHGT